MEVKGMMRRGGKVRGEKGRLRGGSEERGGGEARGRGCCGCLNYADGLWR